LKKASILIEADHACDVSGIVEDHRSDFAGRLNEIIAALVLQAEAEILPHEAAQQPGSIKPGAAAGSPRLRCDNRSLSRDRWTRLRRELGELHQP